MAPFTGSVCPLGLNKFTDLQLLLLIVLIRHPHLSSVMSMGRISNYDMPVAGDFKWVQQVPSQERWGGGGGFGLGLMNVLML